MLRAMLFDFNGVLVDDEPLHLELFRACSPRRGSSCPASGLLPRFLGLDDRGCFAAVLAEAGQRRPRARACAAWSRARRPTTRRRIRRDGYPFFAGAVELVARGGGGGAAAGRGERRAARGGRRGAAPGRSSSSSRCWSPPRTWRRASPTPRGTRSRSPALNARAAAAGAPDPPARGARRSRTARRAWRPRSAPACAPSRWRRPTDRSSSRARSWWRPRSPSVGRRLAPGSRTKAASPDACPTVRQGLNRRRPRHRARSPPAEPSGDRHAAGEALFVAVEVRQRGLGVAPAVVAVAAVPVHQPEALDLAAERA